MVSVYVETTSGIVSVSASAFRREDALALTKAILATSEDLANTLTLKVRADQNRLAEDEVRRSESRVRFALADLTSFRDAQHLIDPVETSTSTGNASRGSFKATPGVSAHNVFLEPGTLDQAGLRAQAGEGLLVQEVSGVHSGANPVTGDFSVGVSGLLFRGGELAEPVREVTVAAHLLDILSGIVAVGSDLRFSTGSVGGSSLLVGRMTVAGR